MVQIETELKEVLGKIDSTLDRIGEDVTELKIGQAKIVGHLERHDSEIATIKEDLKNIKGSQASQIWTLIGILVTAIAGFLAAVAKLVFNF